MVEPGTGALEWVKPPQQARSQKTLTRILEAAEQLVLERGFEGTSIAAVAKRAESSVGAFYSRFPDKQALLLCLRDRFVDQAVATLTSALEPERWSGVPFDSLAQANIRFTIAVFRERANLVSAFSRHLGEDFLPIETRLVDLMTEFIDELVQARGESLSVGDRTGAIRFASSLTFGHLVARAQHLAGGVEPDYGDAELAEKLTKMILAYVGWNGVGGMTCQ